MKRFCMNGWQGLMMALLVVGAFAANASGDWPALSEKDELFLNAWQQFQADEYEEALRTFHIFLQEAPEHLLRDYAAFYSGLSHFHLQHYAQARDAWQQFQSQHPQSLLRSEATFFIAETSYLEGHDERAIQQYQAIRNQDARHERMPDVLLHLGHCYERTGQVKQALNMYRKAKFTYIFSQHYQAAKAREQALLARHPELQKTLSFKERFKELDTLLKSGRAADALDVLTALQQVEVSPGIAEDLHLKQAYTYYVLRNNATALRHYGNFLRTFPDSSSIPYVYDRIGRLHLREQNFEGFLEAYEQLRLQYPTSSYTGGIIRLKGKELVLFGKFEEALAEFTLFMNTFPNHHLFYDVLWQAAWANYQLHRYDAAFKLFDRFVRSYPKSYLWEESLYWAGQSAAKMEKISQAASYFVNIVKRHRNSYYGVLARQRLAALHQAYPDADVPLPAHKMKALDVEPLTPYTNSHAILHREKALSLVKLGLYSPAAKELAYAVEHDGKTPSQYFELAHLYYVAKEYKQLVRLMQRHFWYWLVQGDETLPRMFWEFAFPLAFYDLVYHNTTLDTLDPFCVLALMMAESVFDSQALSPAGARGLMQLMPATGQRMAETLGLPTPSPAEYFTPATNIRLGMTYLEHLLPIFGHQLAPVIASYNAGEHRVTTWWRDSFQENIPAFIATIPYKETRQYVQKVLWYYREYHRIYQ